MNDQIRYLASTHESGHVVAARALGIHATKVEIADTPAHGWLGLTSFPNEIRLLSPTDAVLVDMAGDAAVDELREDGQWNLWQWIEGNKATTKPATSIITTDEERIIAAGLTTDQRQELEARARLLVRANMPFALAIARALADCGRLTHPFIEAIVANETRTRAASGLPGFRRADRI